MSRYRRDDLAYGDDYSPRAGGGGPQRWDRDRFERMRARSRGPGPRYSEGIRVEEDDYYGRGGGRERDIRVEIDEDRRRPTYDRYAYDERYEPPRRQRPTYLEDDINIQSSREIAPYRPRYDREYEDPGRRGSRPQFIRRQSSLDSFPSHRPRYGDEDFEEKDINVSVNLRSPDNLRSPPPQDPRMEWRDEDYRDVRIRRERERDIYRRRRSSSSSEEEVRETKVTKPKRGKTRMPKRLVHWRAILDLGQPYDEEENFYIIRTALSKEEIDTVIEKSKGYFSETTMTTVKVNETRMLEAPAPPPPETYYAPPSEKGEPETTEIIETHTTRIIENPTPEEIEKYQAAAEEDTESASSVKSPSVAPSHRSHRSGKSKKSTRRSSSSSSTTTIQQSQVFPKTVAVSLRSPSPTRSGRRGRSKSRPRGNEIFEEREANSESLTVVLPDRGKSRSRREIEGEIRRLEEEKRLIRREGRRDTEESESPRVEDFEVRVERDDRGDLRFERDAPAKRSKSKKRKPSQRDINAALFSLT